MSQDAAKDVPFFQAGPFYHLSCYYFVHIHKCHAPCKVHATFRHKGCKTFADGTFAESDALVCDKQRLLFRFGELLLNVADVDGHQFVQFGQHQTDRWAILGALMSGHQHYVAVVFYLAL